MQDIVQQLGPKRVNNDLVNTVNNIRYNAALVLATDSLAPAACLGYLVDHILKLSAEISADLQKLEEVLSTLPNRLHVRQADIMHIRNRLHAVKAVDKTQRRQLAVNVDRLGHQTGGQTTKEQKEIAESLLSELNKKFPLLASAIKDLQTAKDIDYDLIDRYLFDIHKDHIANALDEAGRALAREETSRLREYLAATSVLLEPLAGPKELKIDRFEPELSSCRISIHGSKKIGNPLPFQGIHQLVLRYGNKQLTLDIHGSVLPKLESKSIQTINEKIEIRGDKPAYVEFNSYAYWNPTVYSDIYGTVYQNEPDTIYTFELLSEDNINDIVLVQVDSSYVYARITEVTKLGIQPPYRYKVKLQFVTFSPSPQEPDSEQTINYSLPPGDYRFGVYRDPKLMADVNGTKHTSYLPCPTQLGVFYWHKDKVVRSFSKLPGTIVELFNENNEIFVHRTLLLGKRAFLSHTYTNAWKVLNADGSLHEYETGEYGNDRLSLVLMREFEATKDTKILFPYKSWRYPIHKSGQEIASEIKERFPTIIEFTTSYQQDAVCKLILYGKPCNGRLLVNHDTPDPSTFDDLAQFRHQAGFAKTVQDINANISKQLETNNIKDIKVWFDEIEGQYVLHITGLSEVAIDGDATDYFGLQKTSHVAICDKYRMTELPDGTYIGNDIQIIDRIKDIFVLSQPVPITFKPSVNLETALPQQNLTDAYSLIQKYANGIPKQVMLLIQQQLKTNDRSAAIHEVRKIKQATENIVMVLSRCKTVKTQEIDAIFLQLDRLRFDRAREALMKLNLQYFLYSPIEDMSTILRAYSFTEKASGE